MDPGDAIGLIILLILICLSAFFSSLETALTTSNKIRMRSLAQDGNKRAGMVLDLMENQSKVISAILIGNNVVNLSASALATTLTIRMFGNTYVGIGTGILTILILVFGEITPKSYATLKSEKLSLRYVHIIKLIVTIITPVLILVNGISRVILRIMRIDPDKKPEVITEDELRTIVEVSLEEGVIEHEEQKMINNVVDFGDALAKDVMVPRIDMIFVDVNATYVELLDSFKEEMYTRMPVYEETVDNVIGIINMKDVVLYNQTSKFDVRDFIREAYYTYEFKKTSELFVEMRHNSVSMAIVLDEYGSTAGLVTLEDLLEEIVGEIRDEYDESELESVQKVSDYEYLVEGNVKLSDLNDVLDINLESEDYDSVGGIIIGSLDRLPKVGEEVDEGGIRFVVDAVDKNRISWVRLYLPQEEESKDADETDENEKR